MVTGKGWGEEADTPTSQKLTGLPQMENTEIKHASCYTSFLWVHPASNLFAR